jgi:uncharacterized protein YjbI with pentapeptide repeats
MEGLRMVTTRVRSHTLVLGFSSLLLLVSVPTTANAAECLPRPRTQCAGADLTGVNFGGKDLRGANMRGAILRNANLSDAVLTGSDLRRANVRGTELANAYLDRANLSGADLRGAKLFGSYLKNVVLKGTRLEGIDLSQTQGLRNTDVLNQSARLCKTTLPDGKISNRDC